MLGTTTAWTGRVIVKLIAAAVAKAKDHERRRPRT